MMRNFIFHSKCFVLQKSVKIYFWNTNLINLLQASWLGLLNIYKDRRKPNLHSMRGGINIGGKFQLKRGGVGGSR